MRLSLRKMINLLGLVGIIGIFGMIFFKCIKLAILSHEAYPNSWGLAGIAIISILLSAFLLLYTLYIWCRDTEIEKERIEKMAKVKKARENRRCNEADEAKFQNILNSSKI